mmetsp:Transcript_39798/g.85815  ORF Transcript_39798/g.85815 Transcript_39798/m.85815 type:complete len:88 (-) Transcript_39798:12-275(-)
MTMMVGKHNGDSTLTYNQPIYIYAYHSKNDDDDHMQHGGAWFCPLTHSTTQYAYEKLCTPPAQKVIFNNANSWRHINIEIAPSFLLH